MTAERRTSSDLTHCALITEQVSEAQTFHTTKSVVPKSKFLSFSAVTGFSGEISLSGEFLRSLHSAHRQC